MNLLKSKFEKYRNNPYLLYSAAFVLTAGLVFSYFYLNGRTFISHGDGYRQHYKALLYYSIYLKKIFRTIFIDHSLNIPQWDFSIGEGADVLGALHYYCVGDPAMFFSVLVPERMMYAFYDFVVLLKMYLSGLVFTALCEYTGQGNRYGVLSGALIYVFCFWAMLNSNKHIFFLTPMVYLPLIILGVEKIIREDKPLLFILSVFLCAVSHIYFFYMNVLLVVIYVMIRLLLQYRNDLKTMILLVLKLFLNALLSLGLSAVVLLPMVYVFLNNNRIGVDYASHIVYMPFYYERLFTVLFADDYPYWLCMGFASPVVLSMASTVKDFRKKPFLFLINLVSFLMLCFPIVGRIFNGMGYIANRWSYALALVAGYTFACEYETFKDKKKFLLVAVPLFLMWGYVSAWSRTLRVIIPTLICIVYLMVVLLNISHKEKILLCILVTSILFNADHVYSSRGDEKRAYSALSKSDAQEIVVSNEAYEFKKYLQEEKIDEFVRFSGSDLNDNVAMLNDVYGTAYYFSLANPHSSSFRSLLGVTEYSSYRFYSLDQRAALLTLGNVSYYLTPVNYEGVLPYGFDYVKDLGNYALYKNEYGLPFGYSYEEAISYDVWEKLNAVEKEEVLLSKIVVEKEGGSYETQSEKIPYAIAHDDNLEVYDGKVVTKEKDAELTLSFPNDENEELYLVINGLDYTDGNSYFADPLTDVEIELYCPDLVRTVEYHTNEYSFYNGRRDFCAYLGFYPEGIRELKLVFSNPGTYSFEEINLVRKPMDDYKEKTDSLSKVHLEDVVFKNDYISASIDADKERYVLLSIPFSEGWKAFVDGEETILYRANECYMAVKLSSGHHEITLKYETPFLKTGFCISFFSLVLMVVYIRRRRMKKKT